MNEKKKKIEKKPRKTTEYYSNRLHNTLTWNNDCIQNGIYMCIIIIILCYDLLSRNEIIRRK
jgi:hypothetical protein